MNEINEKYNQKTYGMIFYEYNVNNKFNLYLKKNSKDYYEDFPLKDIETINLLKNILILYKTYNSEKNHYIFLLNINKYNELFFNIKKYEIVSFKKFNSIPFHKTLKHNKLKFNDLNKSLNIIKNNYILRKL